MLLFGLRCRIVVGKVVGKLSEITLVTSLLASWENCGHSKCEDLSGKSWCCYKSKVSNFKFPEDSKLPQEWLK